MSPDLIGWLWSFAKGGMYAFFAYLLFEALCSGKRR